MQIYIFQDNKVVSEFLMATISIPVEDHNQPRFTLISGRYFDIRRRFDIVKYIPAEEADENSISYYTVLKMCRANRILNHEGRTTEIAGVAEGWYVTPLLSPDRMEAIYEWSRKYV